MVLDEPGVLRVHLIRTSRRSGAVVVFAALTVVSLATSALAGTIELGPRSASTSWSEGGATVTLQGSYDLHVGPSQAAGTMTGYYKSLTPGRTNYQICTRVVISLYGKITTPSSLRPVIGGFDLFQTAVVGPLKDRFDFERSICRSSAVQAGEGWSSSHPVHWSGNTWRIYKVTASVSGSNYFRNGARAHTVVVPASSQSLS